MREIRSNCLCARERNEPRRDTSQEDQIIERYESVRQTSREGKVALREIKEGDILGLSLTDGEIILRRLDLQSC
jgi:hypothetical protein